MNFRNTLNIYTFDINKAKKNVINLTRQYNFQAADVVCEISYNGFNIEKEPPVEYIKDS